MNASKNVPDTRISTNLDSQEPLPTVPVNHVAHCINSIRESLMCSPDITPIVYYWDERVQQSRPIFDTPHECKNFEGIREWALEHQVLDGFDVSIHAVNPPE